MRINSRKDCLLDRLDTQLGMFAKQLLRGAGKEIGTLELQKFENCKYLDSERKTADKLHCEMCWVYDLLEDKKMIYPQVYNLIYGEQPIEHEITEDVSVKSPYIERIKGMKERRK